MKDFIEAALPFVLCGIAIICLLMNRNKKDTYLCEGMCLGMCFGSMLGAMFTSYLGLTLTLGMLLGEVIGSFFSKK